MYKVTLFKIGSNEILAVKLFGADSLQHLRTALINRGYNMAQIYIEAV